MISKINFHIICLLINIRLFSKTFKLRKLYYYCFSYWKRNRKNALSLLLLNSIEMFESLNDISDKQANIIFSVFRNIPYESREIVLQSIIDLRNNQMDPL